MKCVTCGKEFEARYSYQKYCSEECYTESKRARQRQAYRDKKTPTKVKCAYCGKVFEASVRTQKYCSEECRDAYYAQRGAEERSKPLIKMKCEECGKEFTTRNSTQRYCSKQCAENYRRPKSTAKSQAKTQGKTLDDWCREAAECGLDYGNYRALIECGKTFDELKARANGAIHAHRRKWL